MGGDGGGGAVGGGITRRYPTYPDPICMMCGEECRITEYVATDQIGGHVELWCYCRTCKVDTFHPPNEEEFRWK